VWKRNKETRNNRQDNLPRIFIATFCWKMSPPFIPMALNITCLNIAKVLLPRYKLGIRKICYRKLVSNLLILETRTSNVTFFIVCAARDLRSLSFSPFSFSCPSFLFPLATKCPWRYSTHPTTSNRTANFVRNMKRNCKNYHYQSWKRVQSAKNCKCNHKRNSVG